MPNARNTCMKWYPFLCQVTYAKHTTHHNRCHFQLEAIVPSTHQKQGVQSFHRLWIKWCWKYERWRERLYNSIKLPFFPLWQLWILDLFEIKDPTNSLNQWPGTLPSSQRNGVNLVTERFLRLGSTTDDVEYFRIWQKKIVARGSTQTSCRL